MIMFLIDDQNSFFKRSILMRILKFCIKKKITQNDQLFKKATNQKIS